MIKIYFMGVFDHTVNVDAVDHCWVFTLTQFCNYLMPCPDFVHRKVLASLAVAELYLSHHFRIIKKTWEKNTLGFKISIL